MQFDVPTGLSDLAARLPSFLRCVGEEGWWRRVNQLDQDGRKSPFQAKILADHHWLEMELAAQISILRQHGRLIAEEVFFESMAALLFAGMVVEVSQRLNSAGQAQLAGRLRASLNATFAGLYLELDMAMSLLQHGFDVEFSDLDGVGSADLRFRGQGVECELECKSISADAGRKIHRKDFYRFIDALTPQLEARLNGELREVLIVTLDDRLRVDSASQAALRDAAIRMLDKAELPNLRGVDFSIEREPFDLHMGERSFSTQDELHAACRAAFGANCHAAGAVTDKGACLVVVRSRREDDHSKPALDALKKAASQLSGHHPGFIAIQYEDVVPQDLTLPHLRRRAALLDNALFYSGSAAHVAAVHHSAYNGLHSARGILSRPAFICWNPCWQGSSEGLPFRGGLPNSEFARLLGVDPSKTDPDDYIYGIGL